MRDERALSAHVIVAHTVVVSEALTPIAARRLSGWGVAGVRETVCKALIETLRGGLCRGFQFHRGLLPLRGLLPYSYRRERG